MDAAGAPQLGLNETAAREPLLEADTKFAENKAEDPTDATASMEHASTHRGAAKADARPGGTTATTTKPENRAVDPPISYHNSRAPVLHARNAHCTSATHLPSQTQP